MEVNEEWVLQFLTVTVVNNSGRHEFFAVARHKILQHKKIYDIPSAYAHTCFCTMDIKLEAFL